MVAHRRDVVQEIKQERDQYLLSPNPPPPPASKRLSNSRAGFGDTYDGFGGSGFSAGSYRFGEAYRGRGSSYGGYGGNELGVYSGCGVGGYRGFRGDLSLEYSSCYGGSYGRCYDLGGEYGGPGESYGGCGRYSGVSGFWDGYGGGDNGYGGGSGGSLYGNRGYGGARSGGRWLSISSRLYSLTALDKIVQESQVPPGFRFHPTEEELLQYYLRKKVDLKKINLDVIQDVDLNKLEPWDIQEKCKIGTTPQNDWYFFSHKDKKYPTGTRTNRATAAGFWKATGRDKVIHSNSRPIGRRKTLVFYNGRAPHGRKSDWIMHEYRLDDNSTKPNIASEGLTQDEGWAICRIFKKKNHYKTLDNTRMIITSSSNDQKLFNSSEEGTLDQILKYMGSACKEELGMLMNTSLDRDRFIQLPSLESPDYTSPCSPNFNQPATGCQDWVTLDRMVASHLNGENETNRKQLSAGFSSFCTSSIDDNDQRLQLQQQNTASSSSTTHYGTDSQTLDYNQNDCDLWSCLRRSSLSHCNLPNVPRP
ncbi:unnamed protein product [Fraxinus pennsylvanica]|uniref:NAC domain-containing protein n=1 Tax=Fraxinus pennsylvanica TaxID=56036 RepID=A0AAD1ZFT7_9LAMI|nr:unnamed protein product [Fraxinus pennsylvanica]